MNEHRDYLRSRLYQAIRRFCNGALRKYSRGLTQDLEDFVQQAWVDVCGNPNEESLALAELETHNRLAPCVKKRIRNAIDRQKRYWRRTRPIERPDLVALPNWGSNPLAKERQWARVLGACSPDEQALLGLSPMRHTQREEANSQGITPSTFRNWRKRLLVRLKRVLN
jgi:hypothetical protein